MAFGGGSPIKIWHYSMPLELQPQHLGWDQRDEGALRFSLSECILITGVILLTPRGAA